MAENVLVLGFDVTNDHSVPHTRCVTSKVPVRSGPDFAP